MARAIQTCTDHDKLVKHEAELLHIKDDTKILNDWVIRMTAEHGLLMQQFGEKKGKVSAFFFVVVITAIIALFSLITAIIAIVRHG